MLDAEIAGAATSESAENADTGHDSRSVLPCALRSLHREIPGAGWRAPNVDEAWGCWHPWQRPHGHAGEEQHGNCRCHVPLVDQGGSGIHAKTKIEPEGPLPLGEGDL